MQYYKNITEFVENKAVFCGIDVHKKFMVLCTLCDGEVIEKSRVNNYNSLMQRISKYRSARSIKFVYEAGFSGFWLYRNLIDAGYDCIVTPPALIPKDNSKVKTDKRDAQKLASYLSAGILKEVYVPSRELESDRRVIRRRRQIVSKVTRLKHQIRSFLHLHGIKRPELIKRCWSKAYLAWIENLEFAYPADQFSFRSLLKDYYTAIESLKEVNAYISKLSQSDKYRENYKRLVTLRGVGLVTAMGFLIEIGDFTRFKNTSCFSSYLGYTPGQHSSGEQVRMGHITRQGNAYLRKLLVESAWTVIRFDPHLRAKYERIRARGTNGKKAIVAVARSLAIRLRACIINQESYIEGHC